MPSAAQRVECGGHPGDEVAPGGVADGEDARQRGLRPDHVPADGGVDEGDGLAGGPPVGGGEEQGGGHGRRALDPGPHGVDERVGRAGPRGEREPAPDEEGAGEGVVAARGEAGTPADERPDSDVRVGCPENGRRTADEPGGGVGDDVREDVPNPPQVGPDGVERSDPRGPPGPHAADRRVREADRAAPHEDDLPGLGAEVEVDRRHCEPQRSGQGEGVTRDDGQDSPGEAEVGAETARGEDRGGPSRTPHEVGGERRERPRQDGAGVPGRTGRRHRGDGNDPHYSGRMVRVANDPADRTQTLPSDVADLRALLEHQRALLEREDAVHRVLVRVVLDGGGLAEIAEAVASVFGGAAVVATTDGRVLASAGALGDGRPATDAPCFDRTGRLVVEEEPVGLREAGGPADASRAFVRIVAGSSEFGVLGAFSPGPPLGATDVHMLERAATVAALAVTKEQAVAAVESKYRAEFLRDALAGRAGDPAEAASHAASLGWDIARPLAVVVAETDENDAETTRDADEVRSLQDRFVRAWTQAVRARDASIAVAGFSQEVVVLLPVPEDADPDSVLRPVGELVRVVRGDGGGGRRTFTAGVSRAVTSLADLPRAYEEALTAVRVGRQVEGGSGLTHFDRLGIDRLLALVPDSADLRRFVTESLGELATDDTPENADLRYTLAVLLDTNLNVAETARRLFFHYNTLRYRIAKLERMLGPFTTDPQLRLTLALALRVHRMKGL